MGGGGSGSDRREEGEEGVIDRRALEGIAGWGVWVGGPNPRASSSNRRRPVD